MRLIQRVSLSSQVDYSAENAPLAEVLAELLEPVSYLLFLPATTDDEGIPGTLWIFAEGTIESLAAQEFADAILLHGTVAEKKSTIIELGRRGSLADVQSLSLALGDEDARVRDAALAALSGIGGDDALAAIASAARSGDADMSADAANALGVAGGRSAASYLDIALADDDPRIRAAAVEAFGELGDAAARGRIQAALDDPDAEVRQRAVEALEELDDEALYRALFPGATGMR